MLIRNHLTALFDYCKYFRFQAENLTRETAEDQSIEPGLKAAIIKEQARRIKELKRLEKALGAELEAYDEGSKTVCPGPTTSPKPRATGPRATSKNSATVKKSKGRGAGTTGTSSSAKSANDSNGKRKRGRPRKTPLTK